MEKRRLRSNALLPGELIVMFEIPDDVIAWVHTVFCDCNTRLSEKLSNNPNTPETSLDVTFIEHLSRYASPFSIGKSWTVRIDTHFIGGRRHFYGWEVADIGVLVFYRQAGSIVRKKVALLQSKRLYPLSGTVDEETREDVIIGISTLVQSEPTGLPISRPINYKFDKESKYKVFRKLDSQFSAISQWNQENKVPVHYMFYNPWKLPFSQQVPLSKYQKPSGNCKLGTRVIPSEVLFQHLADKPKNYVPSIGELKAILPKPQTWAENAYGRRLESFFVRLLTCNEGYVFESDRDASIDRLFYRKDAMLSAAISITVELNG